MSKRCNSQHNSHLVSSTFFSSKSYKINASVLCHFSSLWADGKHTGHFSSNLRAALVCGKQILHNKLFPSSHRQLLIYLPLCDNSIHISMCWHAHMLNLSAFGAFPAKCFPDKCIYYKITSIFKHNDNCSNINDHNNHVSEGFLGRDLDLECCSPTVLYILLAFSALIQLKD